LNEAHHVADPLGGGGEALHLEISGARILGDLAMRLAVETCVPISPTETASSSAVAATVCTLAEASSEAEATTLTRSLVSLATVDRARAVSSIVRALSAKAPRMPAIKPRN
jgi:hypothetical protein